MVADGLRAMPLTVLSRRLLQSEVSATATTRVGLPVLGTKTLQKL